MAWRINPPAAERDSNYPFEARRTGIEALNQIPTLAVSAVMYFLRWSRKRRRRPFSDPWQQPDGIRFQMRRNFGKLLNKLRQKRDFVRFAIAFRGFGLSGMTQKFAPIFLRDPALFQLRPEQVPDGMRA